MRTLWAWTAALSIFIIKPATASTTREIYNIAKATSIKINSQNGGAANQGSGFLVKKQGNIYSLVTSKHVTKCLEASCKYTLTASDGQSYAVTGGNIKSAADLDLAVIQFTSPRNYPIVQLAAGNIKANETVYTSGFPVANPGFRFAGGDILANAQRRLAGDKGGYTTIYNAHTNPGMSGGAVFNQQGQVVAVHGHGDRVTLGTTWIDPSRRTNDQIKTKLKEQIGQKAGYNRGVSVNWLRSSELGASIWSKNTAMPKAGNAQIADEFFILGVNKFVKPDENNIKQEKRQAIEYFTKAIQLQPNYGYAYLIRIIAQSQLDDIATIQADMKKISNSNQYWSLFSPYIGDFISEKQLDSWLTDKQNYAQATKLISQANSQIASRPNSQPLVNSQGKMQLYDQAIQLFPKNSNNSLIDLQLAMAYQMRGSIKQQQGDAAGSVADYRQAVKFHPVDNNPVSYQLRGDLQLYYLQDKAAAIADYQQALKLAQQQNDQTMIKSAQFKISSVSSQRPNSGRGFVPTAIRSSKKTRNPVVTFMYILPGATVYKNPDIRKAQAYVRRAYALYAADGDTATIIKYLKEAAKLYKQADEAQRAELVMQVVRRFETKTPW
jgi:tetratricopeptide (TPR) repeat protein